jgi:enamine deaminase RidA (YjgF/YER057c/UK114 family)
MSAPLTKLSPPTLAPSTGYSHVVISAPGRLAFISGQVATNEANQIVGRGDLNAQVVQVMENLNAALNAANTSFAHVIRLNWYVVNFEPSMLPAIREIRSRYFADPAAPPGSTLVGVTALAHEDFLVEVEAVASVPESAYD